MDEKYSLYTKILIVDDEPSICEVLDKFFSKEGYEVSVANNGQDALEMFKKNEPDIVLLDIMLPGRSGKDICSDIRKFSSRPIIMITAKGEVFDKVVCLELGADDFVVKPFDLNELAARVKAVWRRGDHQVREHRDLKAEVRA